MALINSCSADDCYARLESQSEEVTRSPAGFSGLITPAPLRISTAEHAKLSARYELIKVWQATTLNLFIQSIIGGLEPHIAQLLLSELPDHIISYHLDLLSEVRVATPIFFRTDESVLGKIIEVQCPGSLWGVHEQLQDYYEGNGVKISPDTLSTKFSAAVVECSGGPALIHHLLDNLSHPAGERYFVQKVRRCGYARYFGYDKGVRPQECNFIRGHNYLSLITEAFFSQRRTALARGTISYDLPPIAIFDQKLAMSLPFWRQTRQYYSDTVRHLFPYTTLLTPDGLYLEDGELIGIKQFCELPRSRRRYYLKYGGADIFRNWGSKSVYSLEKLSRSSCEKLFERVLSSSPREHWIVQSACSRTQLVEYVTRQLNVATLDVHSKYSCFYGPKGLMGVLAMHEPFYKVHGSEDTITTVARQQEEASEFIGSA